MILDKKEYIEKAHNLLAQPAYRTIEGDTTNKLKAKLIAMLRKIKRESGVEEYLYKAMHPTGCTSPKYYGLPKAIKLAPPQAYCIKQGLSHLLEWLKFLLRYLDHW